jgi:hypothetical protein
MNGLNCHFVSRFLTRPWEHGQRELSYYDFDRNELRSASSRSLFAISGAHPPAVEKRLNQVVEIPIANAMARLVDTNDELLEWPLFRAVSLLLMLQPLRSSLRPVDNERLAETVTRPAAELDEFARAAAASYLTLVLSLLGHLPFAQNLQWPACNQSGHSRWVVKTRLKPDVVQVARERAFTVAEILHWDVPVEYAMKKKSGPLCQLWQNSAWLYGD